MAAEPKNSREGYALKVRVKFEKTGVMRFVGHLDLMRYFQKAMRRAEIPIRYSEGFSPHQIMSFGAPLSLGMSGLGEYMDIELEENAGISSKEACDRLNAVMCPGMHILSFLEIPPDSKPAMSVMAQADFFVDFLHPVPGEKIQRAIAKLLEKNTLPITKKQKKKTKRHGRTEMVLEEKTMDIRPFLYQLEERNRGIFMHISQGSLNNVKPVWVLELLKEEGLKEAIDAGYTLYRTDLYTEEGKTLDAYGWEIT